MALDNLAEHEAGRGGGGRTDDNLYSISLSLELPLSFTYTKPAPDQLEHEAQRGGRLTMICTVLV